MTKKKMPEGKRFQKGNPGGPGRIPTPEEIRKAAKLGKAQFQGLFHKFSLMTYDEFKGWYKAGKMTVMERIIATIMLKAASGNDRAAALIWDRMMGRVKEQVEVSLPKPTVIERFNGDKIVLGHEGQKVIDVEPKETE